MTKQLLDQVAIITGAGRGIGRALAIGFARQGAKILVAARTETELEEAAQAIRAEGGEALAVVADVSRDEDIRRAVEAAHKQWGRVDILVNNAGVGGPEGVIHQLSAAGLDDTLAINVRGPFLCSQAVVPLMLAQGRGNIINVSSGAGQRKARSKVRSLPYQVSKFALEGLTNAMAVQLREEGINVNALQPGRIATRINRASPTEWKPGPEMGQPEDVVPAALFLAALEPGTMSGYSLEAQRFNRGFRPELRDYTLG